MIKTVNYFNVKKNRVLSDCSEGKFIPTFTGFKNNKPVFEIVYCFTSRKEKERIDFLIKLICRLKDIDSYLLINEFWKTREDNKKFVMPENSPDRQDVLMFSSVDKDNKFSQMYEAVVDDDGNIVSVSDKYSFVSKISYSDGIYDFLKDDYIVNDALKNCPDKTAIKELRSAFENIFKALNSKIIFL